MQIFEKELPNEWGLVLNNGEKCDFIPNKDCTILNPNSGYFELITSLKYEYKAGDKIVFTTVYVGDDEPQTFSGCYPLVLILNASSEEKIFEYLFSNEGEKNAE